jgi:hypothetical protein
MQKTDMVKLGAVEVVTGVAAEEFSSVMHLEEYVCPV